MIFINPYNTASQSARELKDWLVAHGHRTLRTQRQPRKHPLIVNWGNAQWRYPDAGYRALNRPGTIPSLRNKLHFFNSIGHTVAVPAWTVQENEAREWPKVVCRFTLEGQGGSGIKIFDRDAGTPWPGRAPLYTRYIPKSHEYRVHVGRREGSNFEVLCVQRKVFVKTEQNPAPRTWDIRSHDNGFTFAHQDIVGVPEIVTKLPVKVATDHFPNIHFAAFDVIYSEKKNQAWVLEGNSAPGLEGKTIDIYGNYVIMCYGAHR